METLESESFIRSFQPLRSTVDIPQSLESAIFSPSLVGYL